MAAKAPKNLKRVMDMIQVNSYFKLHMEDNKTYLIVYPPQEGGLRLEYSEVSEYLSKRGYTGLDIVSIGRALSMDEPSKVLVASEKKHPESEDVKIIVSDDKMEVVARFYPPSNSGFSMTKDDINKIIDSKGIKFGIDEEAINSFTNERIYCTDFVIARGLSPVDGHSAQITYHFQLEKSLKPKENEDGTVDFHSLDNINKISKGDCLATMTPVDYGKFGRDVFDVAISPKKVTNLTFKYGKNIYESADRLQIFSDVEGHVELQGDRVFVSDTYEINDNVSTSTGDINYMGNVHIKGNVLSGFTVRAKGNITIDGVVECAVIDAGGSIILKSGIQGGKRGILRAKNDIVSKFLENAIVRAGNKITTEAILYSDVAAGDVVEVMGRKGFIVGGITRSKNCIICKTVGSNMETRTEVEVGLDPNVLEEAAQLEKIIVDKTSEREKSNQLMAVLKNRMDNGKLDEIGRDKLKKVTENYAQVSRELEEDKIRFEHLRQEIALSEGGYIEVMNVAHVGVKMTLSGNIHYIREEAKHKRFRYINGNIAVEQV